MKIFLKLLLKLIRIPLWYISPIYCTQFQYSILKKLGVKFTGKPRYLSAKIWFDGSSYTNIEIGENVTISSNIRILTHDWAPDTIYHGIYGIKLKNPLGKIEKISIGKNSFIGTGSIIMPGSEIGDYCIVGAGAVVRGKYPSYSIIIGNPSQSLKITTKEYIDKFKVT